MPAKVVWSNQARQALLDIYVAIGLENQAAADRLNSRSFQLADQPRMGPRRPDIGP